MVLRALCTTGGGGELRLVPFLVSASIFPSPRAGNALVSVFCVPSVQARKAADGSVLAACPVVVVPEGDQLVLCWVAAVSCCGLLRT